MDSPMAWESISMDIPPGNFPKQIYNDITYLSHRSRQHEDIMENSWKWIINHLPENPSGKLNRSLENHDLFHRQIIYKRVILDYVSFLEGTSDL
jgi:hypothetical protein